MSCSSGELQASRNDRQCMRCLIHKLECETRSDAYPTRGKFTRSFSMESNRSIEELFKNSDEDFNDPGTKILFCKGLDVTSDEDDDRKGSKRTYEDTEEKETARYKRHRLSDDFIEKRRPTSRTGSRSNHSRRVAKRLPARPSSGSKQKSKPASNRNLLESSSEREIVSRNRITNKVPIKDKYGLEGNEELTIYEKTIITVTSSDNCLLGDPLRSVDKYKSDMSAINFQKMAKVLPNSIISDLPASIDLYGAGTKKKFGKDRSSRDSLTTRSKDMQILPVIQELNNVGNELSPPMIASRTESAMSSDSKSRPKRPQKTVNVGTKNMHTLGDKSHPEDVESELHESKVFPKSCLKKGPVKTNSSKKSVRFLVSESQSNMGGENEPKKSLRLEKFPSVLSVKYPQAINRHNNLTAAPVVLRRDNTTLERMLGIEGLENIIRRETAQTAVQEQVIKEIDIIRNINACGSRLRQLNCPTSLSAPGEPLEVGGFITSQIYPENGNVEGGIHYTLSDLEIPRGKKIDKEVQNMRQKVNAEVTPRGRGKPQASSLDEMRKCIRLKLHVPELKGDKTSSNSRELSRTSAVVRNYGRRVILNDSKLRTERANQVKTRVNVNENCVVQENLKVDKDDGHSVTNKKLGDLLPHLRSGKNQGSTLSEVTRGKQVAVTRTLNSGRLKKPEVMKGGSTSFKAYGPSTTGSKSARSWESPMSSMSAVSGPPEMQKSSSGSTRSRQINENAVESRSTTKGRWSRTDSASPNRPSSRKPYFSQDGRDVSRSPGKDVSRSPDRCPGSPRTPLTLKPNGQKNSKTTSTIREQLRSSQIKPEADELELPTARVEVKPLNRSPKLFGHPLRNKTLSEFLEERKSSMNYSKKKIADGNRRISEPAKRYC